MSYWIMKSEPETYSIDDLKRDTVEPWNGIRNYQVRNMICNDMKAGDLAFFYHSNCNPPGIVGTMQIIKAAYPDHTAFDPDSVYFDPKNSPSKPRWFMVDVKFQSKFKSLISLNELRQYSELKDLLILRKGNRLSITPVGKKEWDFILNLKSLTRCE